MVIDKNSNNVTFQQVIFMSFSRMMDIIELSHKMEANFLESHTTESSCSKSASNKNFSSRTTRSQANKGEEEGLTTEKRNLLKTTDVVILPRKKLKEVEIEKIYLNKNTKVVHNKLETIYEDPVWKKGSTVLLGSSKVKRSIYLDREFRIISKQKSKLRKMKIKKLGDKKLKPFKISDEEFQNKMLTIENYINGNNVELNSKTDECNNCNSKTEN